MLLNSNVNLVSRALQDKKEACCKGMKDHIKSKINSQELQYKTTRAAFVIQKIVQGAIVKTHPTIPSIQIT